MAPADTFSLTLRGYQKQALQYVHHFLPWFSIHAGQLDAFHRNWIHDSKRNNLDPSFVERVRSTVDLPFHVCLRYKSDMSFLPNLTAESSI
jgi:hypothetical protein